MTRRVALVGGGGFGATWRDALAAHGLEVVAVVDPSEEARRAAAELYGVAEAATHDGSSDAWLAGSAPDLVIDSAPQQGRPERARAALSAGVDVLAAKPATETAAEAADLLEFARSSPARVLVAMQKRYLPAFRQLAELCRSGALGRVGFVSIDVAVDGMMWPHGERWRKRMPMPSLRDGGLHHLDFLQCVLGHRVRSVVASSWNPPWSPFEGDGDFSATLRSADGVTTHLVTRWTRLRGPVRHYFEGIMVEGARAAAWVEGGQVRTDGIAEPAPPPDLKMALETLNVDLLGDVLADLADGSDRAALDLATHLDSLRLLEAIERSASRGQVVEVGDGR